MLTVGARDDGRVVIQIRAPSLPDGVECIIDPLLAELLADQIVEAAMRARIMTAARGAVFADEPEEK